jgi:hypothetical protein
MPGLIRRWLLAAIVLAAAAPVATAQAAGSGATSLCVPVRAHGVGQDLGGGRTTATIFSHGVRLGSTSAAFTITGQSGTTASFTGPIVFTSAVGTLTAQVAGTLDTATATGTGIFTATSSSVTGTGLLAGVTGRVTLNGREDLGTGAFKERITGRLCLGR